MSLSSMILDKLFLFLYKKEIRGSTRLANILNIGGIKGRKIIRKNKYGVSLELDPFDYIDSFVLKQGFYESEVFEAILDALPRDGIFWDVGSNAGHHAISIKVKRPLSQVVAFEPSSREIARIVRSANLNGANINILPFALDNKNVLQDFFICQNNSGRNSLERWSDHNAYISSLTQSLTGNEVVDYGYPCPNVIKIDVEGTEERVLIGMKKSYKVRNALV